MYERGRCVVIAAALMFTALACARSGQLGACTPGSTRACSCGGVAGVEGQTQCVDGSWSVCTCDGDRDGNHDASVADTGTDGQRSDARNDAFPDDATTRPVEVHYVSAEASNDVSWSTCLVDTTPCSLNTANREARGGQMVRLLAGTYDTPINPQHSGHDPGQDGEPPFSWIRYVGESTAAVHIAGQGIVGPGDPSGLKSLVSIQGRRFIWLQGLTLDEPTTHKALQLSIAPDTDDPAANQPRYIVLRDLAFAAKVRKGAHANLYGVQHVYIERCRFPGTLKPAEYEYYADFVKTTGSRYLYYHDCYFGSSPHDIVVETKAAWDESYNVYKSCVFENRLRHGARINQNNTIGDPGKTDYYHLVEDSVMKHGGTVPWNPYYEQIYPRDGCRAESGFYLSGGRGIYRFNRLHDNNNALHIRLGLRNSPHFGFEYNHIYNNTIFQTHSIWGGVENCCRHGWCKTVDGVQRPVDNPGVAVRAGDSSSQANFAHNSFINNIIWDVNDYEPDTDTYLWIANHTDYLRDFNRFHNNLLGGPTVPPTVRWGNRRVTGIDAINALDDDEEHDDWTANISTNPRFADIDPDRPTFLQIAGTSPARKAGAPHAHPHQAGNRSATMRISGFAPFYARESWGHQWIAEEVPGASGWVKSDLVYIDGVGAFRVQNVDYSHMPDYTEVTFDRQINGSWTTETPLYFCHDDRCPTGSSIDIGWHQYQGN